MVEEPWCEESALWVISSCEDDTTMSDANPHDDTTIIVSTDQKKVIHCHIPICAAVKEKALRQRLIVNKRTDEESKCTAETRTTPNARRQGSVAGKLEGPHRRKELIAEGRTLRTRKRVKGIASRRSSSSESSRKERTRPPMSSRKSSGTQTCHTRERRKTVRSDRHRFRREKAVKPCRSDGKAPSTPTETGNLRMYPKKRMHSRVERSL
jgi:hypothetical protein